MDPPPKIPLFVRASSVVVDLWPSLVAAIGTIGLALPALAHKNGRVAIPLHPSQPLVVAVAGAFILVGIVASALRQKRLMALQRLLGDAQRDLAQARTALEALARVELAELAGDLRYLSSERVSLYTFAGDSFELLARYSANPTFNEAGRRPYALDCGCLARAWEHNRAHVIIGVRRTEDPEQWAAQHEQSGVSAEFLSTMSMSSRTVIAMRVNDPLTTRGPLGVLVVESEQTAGDAAVDGPPRALLDPDAVFKRLAVYHSRLAGVLSVFAELHADRPLDTAQGGIGHR